MPAIIRQRMDRLSRTMGFGMGFAHACLTGRGKLTSLWALDDKACMAVLTRANDMQ